jgi:putative copper resistance protein D
VADPGPLALDSLNAVVPAAVYLALVRRVRRQGGSWPAYRTAAFVGAVAVAAVATSSLAEDAARRSLAWHMTGQMALLLLVPPAIVAARPLRLAGRALGWRVSLTPSPAAAWVAFVGIQWAVHVPAVFAFELREPAAYGLMHWLLVAAGIAFFAQAGARRMHPLALALYVAAAMPTTDAIGLWLLLDPRVIYSHYPGPGALGDQQAAGAIMFGAGNLLLVAAAWIAGRYLYEGASSPSALPRAGTSPPGTAGPRSPAAPGRSAADRATSPGST